jgi:HlyD family secretion protein
MAEDRFEIDERRSRRFRALLGIVALLALVLCAWWAYPRLSGLLGGSEEALKAGLPQVTSDVPVARGPLTQALLLGGSTEPERTARLAFRAATGRIAMVYAAPGELVQEGQLILELDAAELQRELAKVRGELLTARNDLDKLLEDRGLSKRITLDEELRKARLSLQEAQLDLERFSRGKGTPEERLAKASADLAAAQDALNELQYGKQAREALESQRVTADLAEIEHGPYAWIQNPSEEDRDSEWLLRIVMFNTREAYDQALLRHDMDVRAAERKVTLARRELQTLRNEIAAGSPAVGLKKRQATVQQSEARVEHLQAQLKALEGGDVDPDVAKAEALVVKLQGRAADAEASLAEATIVAPFSGIISEITAQPGATVTPGQQLVTLLSAESLRVTIAVNEMDIGLLSQGQEVALGFDAFPGQSVSGTLGEIPRYGTYQNGITVFNVAVAFDPAALELRAGMSANVTVPLARKESVVKVPTMAVQRDAEGYFVLVVVNGRTSRRAVETGISDGIETEIVQGLQEGEMVRVVLQPPIGPIYR